MLHIENVITEYGTHRVLDGVSIDVNEGQFFCLVGQNGAGKSSLIKSILDFIDITDGSISISDTPHTDINARQEIAFLPERFMPPYYLRGREFLQYILSLYQTSYENNLVNKGASALDLRTSALDESVGTYSKGMAQKLGLLGCLLSRKKLLILDEPMSGLDPKARVLVKRELFKLKEHGTTLFYSSHFLADVEEMADSMSILHGGKIQFTGTPSDCIKHYSADNLEQAFIHCIEPDLQIS